MKTEDLIQALSADMAPTPAGAVARRVGLGLAAGTLAALAGVLIMLGPRRDLAEAVLGGAFWMKAAYTAGLAAAGFFVIERVARPGGSGGRAWLMLGGLALAAIVLGAAELAAAPAEMRMRMWIGHSSTYCLPRIVALAAPVFLGVLWAVRALAPTRLALAGGAAGLLAGAAGATVYGLHCTESTAAFMATWYSLGILLSGVLGAVLGPRLLRW